MPLFVFSALVAALMWVVIVVSIVGLFYAVVFGLIFFVSHLAFVAYVRGSAVKLGPTQFPELHERVCALAAAMGMAPPEAYLMQAGGALNAFATRFLRRNIVVLYSDLLDACEGDPAARDMILAHELAHLRCGHLRWTWFLLPSYIVPFLGSALSRAREYTCDRFGAAGAGDRRGAVRGLAILAAGPRYVDQVNLQALVEQRRDLNTGFMTLGEWLQSHPPLSKRIAAIDDSLAPGHFHPLRGRALALAIIALFMVFGVGGSVALAVVGSRWLEEFERTLEAEGSAFLDPDAGAAQVEADFRELLAFVGANWEADRPPSSIEAIQERWEETRDTPFPADPFDGRWYGYARLEGAFHFWSSGPDGEAGTTDDILSGPVGPSGEESTRHGTGGVI